MKRAVLLVAISIFLGSCGSSKKVATRKTKSKTPPIENKVQTIIRSALTYQGTRYKYGGTTNKGMDCSGLLYVSFNKHEVPLPRTSSMMSQTGKRIKDKEIQKGDLVFFGTGKNRNRINHVGLVVEVSKNEIKFIHATTSRGVLISSLRDGYWKEAYAEARRVL